MHPTPAMDMLRLPEPMTPISYERTYGGNRAFHNFFNDFSHIQDPNLRRRLALSEIDKIPFGLYHVRAVLVAGVGFFLDSYDIFAISLVTTLLGVVFWQGDAESKSHGYGGSNGNLPSSVSQTLKASTSAGIIVGQVLFGWLADKYGRRKMYGVELGIIVFSTLSCCLVSASQAVSFTGLMTFWRVMMGVGIGGDYPLSSVITSEFAPTRWRGAMMAAVFSMQGMGQLAAGVVAVISTVAFRESFEGAMDVGDCDLACQLAADRCWRIIIGVGAVPAVFALYYRITIPETPRYTFEVARDVEKAAADIKAYMASQSEGEVDEVKQARMKKVASPALTVPMASWTDLYEYFSQWANAKRLLGTALSWFFLDLAFYGLSLNNTVILENIGYAAGPTLYTTLYHSAVGTIILVVAGSLPGYWTSIILVDTLGRKTLQIIGFSVLTIVFSVIGFCYHRLSQGALLALYVIANYFFNFGPNTTTFIIPGECFPTRYRSTGHGISAAAGKVGAIVAQFISLPLLTRGQMPLCTTINMECSPFLDKLMLIFALFMLSGLCASLLVPETKGYTLEELAGETPTSYNAGRNGSITAAPKRWWNPFGGGKPAGFQYAHSSPGGFGGSGRNRVDIMTSPEIAAQNAASRRRAFWRRNRPNGDNDAEIHDERPDSASSTSNIAASALPPESMGVLPGWGAGWGRIDRGGRPLALENIRLQDVGSLLIN
ncbi:phosphate permease [Xylariaceae sp. FL0255]|nr:phosphate permease [Xylariaceae sp. FL0255]